MPVYDEDEEEYLEVIPKDPAIEPRSTMEKIKLQSNVRGII